MPTKPVLSPRIQKSPYFDATVRHGATDFMVYNKMYLPFGYADPEIEFRNTIEHVTLWDVAVQRIVEINGPDALRFTDLLTPRDLTGCAPGCCKYVLITAPDGGILNDPVLLRPAEDRFWLSRADNDVLLWAQGVAVNAGMNVTVGEPDVAPLQIQGPKSRAVVGALFGDAIASLGYYRLAESEFEGVPLVISRTGWSGELGFEVYPLNSSRAEQLYEAIMEAGRPHDISPAAPGRIRRIEAGILDYGTDMDATTNPFEIGLERLVDLEGEADFIGKAALARIKAEGITRKLAGVRIEGAPLAYNQEPWPVMDGDTRIGQATSCVHSPRLGDNIGLAMVRLPFAAPGTTLRIETPDGPRAATVCKTPFFDPKKELARE